jgi:hypothetical protein
MCLSFIFPFWFNPKMKNLKSLSITLFAYIFAAIHVLKEEVDNFSDLDRADILVCLLCAIPG